MSYSQISMPQGAYTIKTKSSNSFSLTFRNTRHHLCVQDLYSNCLETTTTVKSTQPKPQENPNAEVQLTMLLRGLPAWKSYPNGRTHFMHPTLVLALGILQQSFLQTLFSCREDRLVEIIMCNSRVGMQHISNPVFTSLVLLGAHIEVDETLRIRLSTCPWEHVLENADRFGPPSGYANESEATKLSRRSLRHRACVLDAQLTLPTITYSATLDHVRLATLHTQAVLEHLFLCNGNAHRIAPCECTACRLDNICTLSLIKITDETRNRGRILPPAIVEAMHKTTCDTADWAPDHGEHIFNAVFPVSTEWTHMKRLVVPLLHASIQSGIASTKTCCSPIRKLPWCAIEREYHINCLLVAHIDEE